MTSCPWPSSSAIVVEKQLRNKGVGSNSKLRHSSHFDTTVGVVPKEKAWKMCFTYLSFSFSFNSIEKGLQTNLLLGPKKTTALKQKHNVQVYFFVLLFWCHKDYLFFNKRKFVLRCTSMLAFNLSNKGLHEQLHWTCPVC